MLETNCEIRTLRLFIFCVFTSVVCYLVLDIIYLGKLPVGALMKRTHHLFSHVNSNNTGIDLDYNMSAYPLDIDFKQLLIRVKSGANVTEKVVNPHPYTYVHLPPSCPQKTQILILVTSATFNDYRRTAIRLTWGSNLTDAFYLVFLLGDPKSSSFQKNITKEYNDHKDVVQENFPDTYRNLLLKKTMGFYWGVQYCSAAKYFLFVDDDTFIFPDSLLGKINSLPLQLRQQLYTGFMYYSEHPYRNKNSRYFVSLEDYPYNSYPPYIRGGAYLLSSIVAKDFTTAFPYIKPMPMEDVWMGIVARKLGTSLTNDFAYSCQIDYCRQRLKTGKCIAFVGVKKYIDFQKIFSRVKTPNDVELLYCNMLQH